MIAQDHAAAAFVAAGVPRRIARLLTAGDHDLGIMSPEQFQAMTDAEILRCPYVGKRTLAAARAVLPHEPPWWAR